MNKTQKIGLVLVSSGISGLIILNYKPNLGAFGLTSEQTKKVFEVAAFIGGLTLLVTTLNSMKK